MNTRIVLGSSGLAMGVVGLLASFLPHEILTALQENAAGLVPVLVQVLGALYLGFGILNWMSKGVRIGGIYARPVATGNFLHFFAGAMALLKGISLEQSHWLIMALAGVYALYAVLFGLILFRDPLKAKDQ